jgi:hypothetical protein
MLDADVAASPATPTRRLQLVAEASQPNVRAPAATHDLFGDKDGECSADLTDIYVPIVVDAPRDPESQRRFEEFWHTKPVPVQERPAIFGPVFPRVPLLQRTIVRATLVSAAAIVAVAWWVGIFVLLAAPMSGAEASRSVLEVKSVGSDAAPR